MEFSLNIDAEKIKRAFESAAINVGRELRIEMRNACDVVRRDASVNHRFKSGTGHSGNLQRSIKTKVADTGLEGTVYLDTGVAAYGPYQHEGTRDHSVAPKNKKALYWVAGGKGFFSKGHRVSGIKKDQFLYASLNRQKPFIMARLKAAVSNAFSIAGLK